MAFAAVYFPRDNDQSQLPLWPDNEELTMAGDNFCDQFITFDIEDATALGGDIEDPPSPSILLESLHGGLNSSLCPLDIPADVFHPEAPATAIGQQISNTRVTTSENPANSNSAALSALARDPILSTGSISDSELLRLEGISLKSSPHRGSVTAPSSPRKHNQFVDPLHGNIRGTTNHLPPTETRQFETIDMADMDIFLDDARSGLDFFDSNYHEFGDSSVPIKQEPIDNHGLPISPPLTGRIPNARQSSSSGFVTGHIEDPFCDDPVNAPVTIRSLKRQPMDTPMSTPNVKGETFLQANLMTPLDTNIDIARHPQKAYRSTSSAKWPTEGFLTDVGYNEDTSMWSSSSSSAMYIGDNGSGSIPNPSWWNDMVHKGETSHAEPTHHRHTAHGNGVLSNAAHNLSMHKQQAEIPYEYNAELSGLMIHMPQPRVPQASVLNSNPNEHVLTTPTLSSSHYHTPTMTRTRSSHMQYNGSSSKGYGNMEKRPRPRAPSSGARHHGAQTSPRKLRNSMSLGYLREESQSPSPMSRQHKHAHAPAPSNGHHTINHQERRQHRSSSLTMRKQRSFTRRESRTSSASFAASPTRAASSSGPSGTGGGGRACLDFVNFTPNDGSVLMTGVAPSGSSKTKERREREAKEKAKQLSDLAFKVVEAAGGDVTKLIGDFVI
ncbi:hypothetical protein F5B22DRAFT_27970 [Xylaria bambusicola]|uniref:uncharacterized protein n=1 Tax=Xylaria bambusicola TaxID=326684 RepID=UPI002008E94F|nr:uncharacterized protein F5B22DRAFT_27970 [Xylaria bambusicola]KAI0528241.1 hypothetical protein F5B22DRAFT_27970 [Xylaria bambusicola]